MLFSFDDDGGGAWVSLESKKVETIYDSMTLLRVGSK